MEVEMFEAVRDSKGFCRRGVVVVGSAGLEQGWLC
jgi:hypothetical protein